MAASLHEHTWAICGCPDSESYAGFCFSPQLQDQLSALGLTDAWDQKVADFSGVSVKSKGKVHLGGVLQWASLELAAQAGKGDGKQQEGAEEQLDKPKLFYADHPFIILVRDNATGSLLLIGALDHVEGETLHDEL